MSNWRMNGVNITDHGVWTKIICENCGYETECRPVLNWPKRCEGCGEKMDGVNARDRRENDGSKEL